VLSKSALLGVLLSVLVCCAFVSEAFALPSSLVEITSDDFTEGGQSAGLDYDANMNLTTALTNPFTLYIDNDLTYGATTQVVVVCFSEQFVGASVSATADGTYFRVSFYGNDTLKIFANNDTSENIGYSSTVTYPITLNVTDTTLTLTDSGSVSDTTDLYTAMSLGFLAYCCGSASTVSAGSLTIQYDSGDVASAVNDWIPVVVEFAMLGMVMGLLKKMGKW
jgi:hypothetical protein